MSQIAVKDDLELKKAVENAKKALSLVSLPLPHLSGLARLVRICLEPRIETAGIFESGRLLLSPSWFNHLKRKEQVFVIAHEIMHLLLFSHSRGKGVDPLLFNMAHDYIINDTLRSSLRILDDPIPAGGLDWEGASEMSVEELIVYLQRRGDHSSIVWRLPQDYAPSEGWDNFSLSEQLLGLFPSKKGSQKQEGQSKIKTVGDIWSKELERELYPELCLNTEQKKSNEIKIASEKASLLEVWREVLEQREHRESYSGRDSILVRALQLKDRPPWENVLQRWMETFAPNTRSYTRASRRGQLSDGIVRPGRKREGWILHIVLDTSGSMSTKFPLMLGMIAGFCESVMVEQVRIIQCDTKVTFDEMVYVENLHHFNILGMGGSNMSSGMLRLAADPEVEAAIVLTDGFISYPKEKPPYHVLWGVTNNSCFKPPYGEVLRFS